MYICFKILKEIRFSMYLQRLTKFIFFIVIVPFNQIWVLFEMSKYSCGLYGFNVDVPLT